MNLVVCSAANLDQLPHARVLIDSLHAHHDSLNITVLFIAPRGSPRPTVPGCEVLSLEELGIDDDLLDLLTVAYSPGQLSTVFTPWLLERLLDRGNDHAVYLDPGTWCLAPFETLQELAREHAVVLTPQVTSPLPRDGKWPSEQDVIADGAFNLGFVAVGAAPDARRMLRWWIDRLSRGQAEPTASGYLDQRAMDLVPALFRHHVITDTVWNVGHWNVATRTLDREPDGRVTVDGAPLVLLNLKGYSPDVPHLVAGNQAVDSRVWLSEHHVLQGLCETYADLLVKAGWGNDAAGDAFAEVDGLRLDDRAHRVVSEHLLDVSYGTPAGFSQREDGQGLAAWLSTPTGDPEDTTDLGRYLSDLYRSRPDLHFMYPGVQRGEPQDFLDWCQLIGTSEVGIPMCLIDVERERHGSRDTKPGSRYLPGLADSDVLPREPLPGVDIIGFLSAELGIGQAARMLVSGLDAAGIPVSTLAYTRTSSRLEAGWVDRHAPPGTRYDTVIACINADMIPTFIEHDHGRDLLTGRYAIGFWFWELDDFPDHLMPALDPLDEIWVTSDFTADVIRARTRKPVLTVPLPVHAPTRTKIALPELAGEHAFTFLFTFDYLSVFERKNPLGLVDAFTRAFPEPGEARLVIKSVNGDRRPLEREQLRYEVRTRPDIVLIERYLSRDDLDGLFWLADCYVSLHRSEGFGLGLAESMAIGKPVIGTGYSGNTTFMRPTNSRLVDFKMVKVPEGCDPYPPTSRWAAARRQQAARLMRRIFEDPDLRTRLGDRARRDMQAKHSVENLSRFVVQRLGELDSVRTGGQTGRRGLRGLKRGRSARA